MEQKINQYAIEIVVKKRLLKDLIIEDKIANCGA